MSMNGVRGSAGGVENMELVRPFSLLRDGTCGAWPNKVCRIWIWEFFYLNTLTDAGWKVEFVDGILGPLSLTADSAAVFGKKLCMRGGNVAWSGQYMT